MVRKAVKDHLALKAPRVVHWVPKAQRAPKAFKA
jgi:hypothetical protein